MAKEKNIDTVSRGSSTFNTELDPVAIDLLNQKLGYKLKPAPIKVKGATIQVDGYDPDKNIICEVYCGIDEVKPGQVRKVITDAFKMIAFEKVSKKPCTKILLFVDETVMKRFQSKSWYSMAFKEFGIETEVVPISEKEIAALKATKERQGAHFK